MTIRAFSELYLSDAQTNLANAFDYALNTCKQSPDVFAEIFRVPIMRRNLNAEILQLCRVNRG